MENFKPFEWLANKLGVRKETLIYIFGAIIFASIVLCL